MTFASEKSNTASNRFALLRIKPSRDITAALASEGGGVYSYAWDYIIPSMTREGDALTRVSVTPTVNDTFYYNKDEKKVYVKLASAPNTSTNIIIADYYLFFTNEIARRATENPTGGSFTEEELWEPRLITTPAVSQSIKNLLTGQLSLAASNAAIANHDQLYNSLFTADDSWRKKEVLIWYGIDNTSNLQKVFEGAVKGVNFNNDILDITFLDKLTILSEPAYMGDTRLESFFLPETGSAPNVFPAHANRPNRYIVGSSYAEIINGYNTGKAVDYFVNGTGVFGDAYYLDPSTLIEATCLTNFPNNVTGASGSSFENRTWGCGRVDVLKFPDFGTISAATLYGGAVPGAWVYYRVPARSAVSDARRAYLEVTATGHNIKVGDSWRITNTTTAYTSGGGGSEYGVLCVEVTATGYKCAVFRNWAGLATPNPPAANESWVPGAGITWHSIRHVSVIIVQNSNNQVYFPIHGTDSQSNQYEVSVSITSSGNVKVNVIFEDDFEGYFTGTRDWFTEIGWSGALHPDTHKVYFRLQSDNDLQADMTHGKVIERIADKGGFTITSSSVTAADAALDTHCQFTIPKQGDSRYQNYFHYIEKILKSTLGYIRLNNSDDFDYELYDAPSSTNERTKNLIVKDTFKVQVVYDDIITELETTNPEATTGIQDEIPDSEQFVTNTTDLYLHGINQQEQLEVVTTDMSVRAQDIVDFRSKRKVIYSFEVATEDLDSQIGDDIKIVFEHVLGTTTEIEGKIIGLNKTLDKVRLQVTDLEGL